jgi:hypothetical protein
LRNASDQFFEWLPEVPAENTHDVAKVHGSAGKEEQGPPVPAKPRRPKSLVEAVTLLTSDAPEGKVALGTLGQYLKRTDPGFSPTAYGHSGLLDMIKKYDLLAWKKEEGGHYTVRLAAAPEEGSDGKVDAA